MSNSKVRKQIEAMEAKGKVLEAYKKKADFILDYQVCKAYFKDKISLLLIGFQNLTLGFLCFNLLSYF